MHAIILIMLDMAIIIVLLFPFPMVTTVYVENKSCVHVEP
jgi:hypothetical protein